MIQVVCVRVGTLYGPEYVEILRDMVDRNLTEDFTFHQITDQPEQIDGVNNIAALPRLEGWWQKLALFSPHMPWAEGDRVIYFDLDVAITGRLEGLPKGIIRDWHLPGYNSSVMVWDHGEHRDVWERFIPQIKDIHRGDQDWITEVGGWDTFPPGMFASYRSHAIDGPPAGAVAVIFHGEPKPPDCGGWVKDIWRVGGHYVLPKMDGGNVPQAQILKNVEANCKRPLPWFIGFPKAKEAVVVCGGPSLKRSLFSIRNRQKNGALIIAVNGVGPTLKRAGIKVDGMVMLDARPENIDFVKDGRAVIYYLASQCDPSVFDALKDQNVVVWHCANGQAYQELMDTLAPYDATHPIVVVPGGGTVGLRAINLCWISGFKRIHVYGMDSSYEGTDHHAYAQPLNDGDRVITLKLGDKEYRAAIWMARQAEEFREAWVHLKAQGVMLKVHGRGLIPDLAKALHANG